MKTMSILCVGLMGVSAFAAEKGKSNVGVQAEVGAIKKLYAEVTGMQLKVESFEIGDGAEMGELTRWRDGANQVRRVTINFGSDHGGYLHDVIYDGAGNPRFVLGTSSSWRFAGAEDVTEDRVRQKRIYLKKDGTVVRVLEKKYLSKAKDKEADLKKQADAAKNVELKIDEKHSATYVALVRTLKDVKKDGAEALAIKLGKAWEELGKR